ncbi:MAG: patatin-like phospholipase family protein [Nitrospira sp.]|nr:patatin-like phospholipase family protein [Nitrospira sp.]
MTNIQEPPVDRFCDLVMKGGITSGVVYPKAIELLSHQYRFKSIGGTSAGAIEAVVTAAAEYQRRHTGSRAGFDLLAGLPMELQQEVAPGKSKLLSLFQPQPTMRRLFSVLIGALNCEETSARIARIIAGFLWAYWPATLAALFVSVAGGVIGGGWFAAILTLVIALPLLVGFWVYVDVTQRMVANDLGLCSGLTEDARHEALTPWLHALIQKAAGRSLNDPPLTFGDLWDAPGFPPSWLKVPADPKPRSIDLQMFSTNLSHGRPYIFPLSEKHLQPSRFRDRERLYFREEEMKRCLPADLVAWMVQKSQPYIIEQGRDGKDPSTEAAQGKRELPEPRHFPVLLAARMSLSFPFLFTAIPLHAIDHDPPDKRQFRRCWFSDGGISSNFPMHLFDGLVPMWPTFGISLEPEIERRDPVFLPVKYDQGYGERWNHFAEEKQGVSMLGGFISAIVSTMQNWNDNSLARMPGVRDRVARVRLNAKEGGMNLNMEARLIKNIAERGVQATKELLQRFAPSSNGEQAEGWNEHRFVRLHVLLTMLEARSPGLVSALSPTCGHATDFLTLLNEMMNAKRPPGYENAMTKEQCQELHSLIKTLQDLAGYMVASKQSIFFKPIPKPELRVRPSL